MSKPSNNGADNAGPLRLDFAAIRADNPIADTIGHYLELRRQGSEYVALCPFHADKTPSFCVVPRKEKAFCMACGWHGDVVDFIAEFEQVETVEAARRLGARELPANRPALPPSPPDDSAEWTPTLPVPADAPAFAPSVVYNPRRGKTVDWSRIITRQDAYRDADGQLLGYVCRLEIDGKKLTPAVTYARHADGRQVWASVKFPEPRPLQGLDELARRPQAPVLVVSGEKCREAGAKLLPGFVVVTWIGGDQNVNKADWSPLRGRTGTFWPDADPSGVKAMETAARLALCSQTRMMAVEDLVSEFGKGADIADLAAAGWTTQRVIAWAKERVREWRPETADAQPDAPEKSPAPGARDRDHAARPPQGKDVPPAPAGGEDTAPGVAVATAGLAVDPVIATPLHDDPPQVVPIRRPDAALETAADPDEDGLPEMYSEDNVALRFSQIYADDLRYVSAWGRWMRWSGQRWEQDDSLMAFDLSRKVCRSVAAYVRRDVQLTPKQQQSVATKYGQAVTVAAIERMAKADRRHAATVDQWDADLWALNTPAGVLDLRTGRLRAPIRSDHMTKITRVAPAGDCPTWMRFLDVATAGDAELQAFLQRMAGYALTGSTRDHALFFVYGTGGNGKGTFLNTLTHLLGDYAQPASMDVFTESKGDRHPTELASLRGARLVSAQETEEGKRWAEARIKALTGGDPIRARYMRQDEFTFVPQFKLIIAGNHKPGLRNVDEAIKRRLHMVPFTVNLRPDQRDPQLPDKLLLEGPGILAWAVQGCLEWQRAGLRPPERVLAATDEYLEQQDTLGAWIEECCDMGGQARSSSLYANYKGWAERSGEFCLPLKRWVGAMESRGLVSRKSAGVMVYDGIRTRIDPDMASRYGIR